MITDQLGLIRTILVMSWLIHSATIGGGGGVAAAAPAAKPGCSDSCGSIMIPYPFGIGPNCYANHSFAITCNNSSKPILSSINLQVLEISLENRTIRVNGPVTVSDCPAASVGGSHLMNLSGTPFLFSQAYNLFTGIGCNSFAQMFDVADDQGELATIGGCMSMCSNGSTTGSNISRGGGRGFMCYGINCCQTAIPPSLKVLNVSLSSISTTASTTNQRGGCKYGFLAEQDWYNNLTDPYAEMQGLVNVPVVLDWRTDEKCYLTFGDDVSPLDPTGGCYCPWGYEGNPYLQDIGCSDVDECQVYPGTVCAGDQICYNNQGSYECSDPVTNNKRNIMSVYVGIGSGVGGLLLIIGSWWLWKIIKRRKKAKLMKKFFKRNGGLLLQQQLTSADQGYVKKTKVFTAKELEKATDNYNENRILGQGGQGTVYKGMLINGTIVAVKKSKVVDEGKLEEFINEVIILSQINHRNVVKLHGCCLETEVPLLVYDFIPNGTLYEYIQRQGNDDFSLTWEVRLRIASEAAEALAYLHSAASVPIYHRDIKSTNILLDDKYRAKVADFGTSRSATIDQTHMTTKVQGTFGYLDPEYFQSSQFTAKSDVYSFGVVLLELLTGQKAVLPKTFAEGRSLATHFMLNMKENRLFETIDAQVMKEGGEGDIIRVANLARRCLNLNGRKRPTMKEVAMELEAIRASLGEASSSSAVQECYEEEEVGDLPDIIDVSSNWDTTSSTTFYVEDKPLLLT